MTNLRNITAQGGERKSVRHRVRFRIGERLISFGYYTDLDEAILVRDLIDSLRGDSRTDSTVSALDEDEFDAIMATYGNLVDRYERAVEATGKTPGISTSLPVQRVSNEQLMAKLDDILTVLQQVQRRQLDQPTD